jgi:hypothetical protein
MVVPSASGILAFSGRRDRGLGPIVPPQYASPDYLTTVPMRAGAIEPESLGHAVLVIGSARMGFLPPAGPALETSLPRTVDAAALRDAVAVADIDADGIDELLLALPGDDRLHLYKLVSVAVGGRLRARPVLAQRIEIRGDAVGLGFTFAKGAAFVDVDGDGLLDAAASGLVSGRIARAVVVARNLGNGTFEGASISSDFYGTGFADECGGDDPWPLAMGALRRGSQFPVPPLDLVFEDAICVRQPSGAVVPAAVNPSVGAPWIAAAIADFNRDGQPDVATTAAGDAAVTFWLNNGAGSFSPFVSLTGGLVTGLRAGDFDGDGFADLAAIGEPGDLSIFYGVGQGAPDDAVAIGNLGALAGIAPARLVPTLRELDAIDDLVLLRDGGTTREVGFLYGSPRRRMFSPISLEGRSVTAVLVGRFDGDAAPDVIGIAPPGGYLLSGTRGDLGVGLAAPIALAGLADAGPCTAFASGTLDGTRHSIAAVGVAAGELEPCAMVPFAPVLLRAPDLVPSPLFTSGGDTLRGQLFFADLGGDGKDEVLGILGGALGVWNDVGGVLVPETIDRPAGVAVAAAALNIDADADRELAVATADGTVHFVDRDATGRLAAGRYPGLQLQASDPARVSLTAADVDGDGLMDLVVNAPPFVEIYLQLDAR